VAPDTGDDEARPDDELLDETRVLAQHAEAQTGHAEAQTEHAEVQTEHARAQTREARAQTRLFIMSVMLSGASLLIALVALLRS